MRDAVRTARRRPNRAPTRPRPLGTAQAADACRSSPIPPRPVLAPRVDPRAGQRHGSRRRQYRHAIGHGAAQEAQVTVGGQADAAVALAVHGAQHPALQQEIAIGAEADPVAHIHRVPVHRERAGRVLLRQAAMHGGQHQEVRVGAVGLCQQHIGALTPNRVSGGPPSATVNAPANRRTAWLARRSTAPLALMNPLDSTLRVPKPLSR